VSAFPVGDDKAAVSDLATKLEKHYLASTDVQQDSWHKPGPMCRILLAPGKGRNVMAPVWNSQELLGHAKPGAELSVAFIRRIPALADHGQQFEAASAFCMSPYVSAASKVPLNADECKTAMEHVVNEALQVC